MQSNIPFTIPLQYTLSLIYYLHHKYSPTSDKNTTANIYFQYIQKKKKKKIITNYHHE